MTTTPQVTTPVPDPTELTDKAIAKAVAYVEQLVEGKFELLSQRDEIRDRETLSQLRERDGDILALRELLTEKQVGLHDLVDERFEAAERLRIEQKKDTKDAVDAALTAQKEAVKEQTTASALSIAKSETATNKQLEQQQVASGTAISELRRSIDELKERAVEESRTVRVAISEVATTAQATIQQKIGAKEDRTALYAVIGVIGTILGIIITASAVLSMAPHV